MVTSRRKWGKGKVRASLSVQQARQFSLAPFREFSADGVASRTLSRGCGFRAARTSILRSVDKADAKILRARRGR